MLAESRSDAATCVVTGWQVPTQLPTNAGLKILFHKLKKDFLAVSLPAYDVSHKRGGRLSLLSATPAVTPATLKRAATSFAAW